MEIITLYFYLSHFEIVTKDMVYSRYSKTCVKQPLSKTGKLGQVWYLIVSIPDLCTLTYFQDQLSLNATVKLPFVIKIFVLSILSGCFTQVLLYIVYMYST